MIGEVHFQRLRRFEIMAVAEVTDATFESDVLRSEKPVIVDFWAPWCVPCRRVSPILEEMSEAREDVNFVKVNVDDNPQAAMNYSISSIPTIPLRVGAGHTAGDRSLAEEPVIGTTRPVIARSITRGYNLWRMSPVQSDTSGRRAGVVEKSKETRRYVNEVQAIGRAGACPDRRA